MSEQQKQRKTSMTDEKFNNYNKWCSKSTASSFDNNRNFPASNQNETANVNFMNKNYNESPQQQKRRRNDDQSQQNDNKRAFHFNSNAYYHSSMLEDPWFNLKK
jgi:hypothetical protein